MESTPTTNNSPEIYKAMAAIMADIPAIGKGKRNQQQGFNYRGIDDVYNAINPLMAKNGVFVCPEVLGQSREERTNKNGTVLAFVTLNIKYTFYAQDGSSVSCLICGEGMDSGDKATNKAMSIAQKYAFFQVFCIPTESEDLIDPDKESFELAAKAKAAQKPEPKRPNPKNQAPTDKQFKALHAAIRENLPEDIVKDKDKMLAVLSNMFSREITSSKDLSAGEVSAILTAPQELIAYIPKQATGPQITDYRAKIRSKLGFYNMPVDALPDAFLEQFDTVNIDELSINDCQRVLELLDKDHR